MPDVLGGDPYLSMSDDDIRALNRQLQEKAFTGVMARLGDQIFIETKRKYNPKKFRQMVKENGGHKTALSLVGGREPTDGFLKLLELKRVDLAIEVSVISHRWENLFSDEVKYASYRRLIDAGFKPLADSWHP